MKGIFSKSILAMCGIMCLASCGKKEQRQMPQAKFETQKAATKSLTLQTKYSATIRGRQDIDVYPQVGGTLQQLCVTEGQKVTKGQTLFIIDQVPYQAQLNTAEAALEAAKAQQATAQLNYDSRVELRAQNVISDFDLKTSENQLLAAKAQVAQATAQVINARNSLSYTVVKSPANGVVGTLPYRQGALVSPQMPKPLTTVSDNNQMYVYFSITEGQLLKITRESGSLDEAIKAMPELTLKLVDGSTYDIKGKVESASGVVDRSTGSVQLRAVFDNPNKVLLSGSTGYVEIPVEYTDQIVIPITATVQMQNKFRVWLVQKDSTATEQIVTLGEKTNGQEVIVLEGLKPGQEYVSLGAAMVKHGQKVK